MARELKVYGWTGFVVGTTTRQARIIVAERSFAAARRAADAAGLEKPRRDYTSETGNETELDVALAHEGTVFAADNDGGDRDYWRVESGRLCKRTE